MTRTSLFVTAATILVCWSVYGFQENEQPDARPQDPGAEKPGAPDLTTIDGLMKELYSVISGPAGQKRDWARLRTLFTESARMYPLPPPGSKGSRLGGITVDTYIEKSQPFFEKQGFFETEVSRTVNRFGNLAEIFSTYECFHDPEDDSPFLRGINGIQLVNDGTRWWVTSLAWQAESKDLSIPEKYEKR